MELVDHLHAVLELLILGFLFLLLGLGGLLGHLLLGHCLLGLDDHCAALQLLLPVLAELDLSGRLFPFVLVLSGGTQVVAVADQGLAEVDLKVVGVAIDKRLLLLL